MTERFRCLRCGDDMDTKFGGTHEVICRGVAESQAYNAGGYLHPGWTRVHNTTGHAEHLHVPARRIPSDDPDAAATVH